MLTTSRGTVISNGNYSTRTYNETAENREQAPSYYESPVADGTANSEYSLDEIAKKILGGSSSFPTESEDIDMGNPSVAPSARTMSCADECVTKYNLYADGAKPEVNTKAKLNTQVKIAALSFTVVTLVLAVLIAVMSANVSGGFQAVTQLGDTHTEQLLSVQALSEQVSKVDEAQMLRLAQEAGYSLANEGNTVYFTAPATRGPQTFAIESNWFDSLCDYISGVFGG